MQLLSSMWNRIQSNLFPFLEEELGELNIRHKKLVSVLEVIRIEGGSDCVKSQGKTGDQSLLSRIITLRIVINFRIQATIATLNILPLLLNRS